MIEEWRACIKAPKYEVSCRGRVRREGRDLKVWINDRGYGCVDVGKNKKLRVHRMVYEAFHGPIPTDHVIDHINFQKADNRLENLEAVTQAENMRRAAIGGRCGKQPRRKSSPRTTESERNAIIQMRLLGMTNAQVCAATGRARSLVQKVFSGHAL